MSRSLICSRSDRLGDLVLTLPALGLLRRALPTEKIGLHVSEYASDLARLALENGICDSIVFRREGSGEFVEEGAKQSETATADLIAFFHGPEVKKLQRRQKFPFSLSPRTRISTMWNYSKTVVQNRSQVEKSEMEYNLDLARAYLNHRQIQVPEFSGLPKLKIPKVWQVANSTAHKVAAIFVNNGASAKNWPVEKYLTLGRELMAQGFEVHFHYAGVNGNEIKNQLAADSSLIIKEPFSHLKELLVYISNVSYLVASSTGPLHLGHALGVRVLGVYPREPRVQSFKRWRPQGYWHNQAIELIEF